MSRYCGDVLSTNNINFANLIPCIYPQWGTELEKKETTETASSAPFLDIYLKFDYIRLYDKRVDFNFAIINFPHLDSNIPTAPA